MEITKTDFLKILSLLKQCEKLKKEDKIHMREIARKAKVLNNKLKKQTN